MNYFNRIRRNFKRVSEKDLLDIKAKKENEWLQKDNVHGIAVDKESIIIFVDEKYKKADFDSYTESKIKFVVTEPFYALARTDRIRPIQGGISVGHISITAGTLSLMVQDKTTKEPLILSNNHVLANVNKSKQGDKIVQPGVHDGGTSADVVGYLERFAPLQTNATVDAAVAKPIDAEVFTTGLYDSCQIEEITMAFIGQKVRKIGRTTGITSGVVTVTNATVKVNYSASSTITLRDIIVTTAYSQGGDSGSSVLELLTNKLIGILFGGNNQYSLVCKIQSVFDQLNLELLPVSEQVVLDISQYNGNTINVNKAKSNNAIAVYARLCAGESFKDSKFNSFWDACKNNIPISPYVVVQPRYTAEQHFRNFKDALGERVPDFPVMLDCELTDSKDKAQVTSVIQRLAKLIEDYTREKFGLLPPLIYTRASWWNVYVLPWSEWKRYGLMIARWNTDKAWYGATDPYKPRDWNVWELWQFSADGNMKGSKYGLESNSVDLSRVSKAFIEKYLSGNPPPPPPPPNQYPKAIALYNLNVRNKPDITGTRVGSITKNTVIEVIEEVKKPNSDIWVRIDDAKYCAMRYNNAIYMRYL